MLLLNAAEGGVALALFAAAWAPVLLMVAMLLSVRATKALQPRRFPWLSLLGVAVAVAAIWWPVLELTAAAPVEIQNELAGWSFWLAPLVAAAGVGCVGVLGFGERGSLRQRA